jgi:hypothetical protein
MAGVSAQSRLRGLSLFAVGIGRIAVLLWRLINFCDVRLRESSGRGARR